MPAWLGGPEIVVIVLVIVIVFGWKKLPDAARSLGRSMRIFKSEVDELKREPDSAASRDTVEGNVRRENVTTRETVAPADGNATTRVTEERVTEERVAPREQENVAPRVQENVDGTAAGDPRTDAENRA